MTGQLRSIKEAIKSRHPTGLLIEADYRQLEIRVLALATMDSQLIADINSGIDLHRYFASQIYDKPEFAVTDEERKLAKGFSFQLQYGATAYGIAKHWNVDKKFVQKFIDAYYDRYPEVGTWQQENIEYAETESNTTNEGHRVKMPGGSEAGEPVLSTVIPGIWEGPQNPLVGGFHMNQSFSGWEKNKASFSPTQIKNYPVQGGAADLILLMLGALNSNWYQIFPGLHDMIEIVNTVHDSFLFDVNANGIRADEIYVKLCVPIKETLEQLPALIHDMFGIHSPVEFPVDIAMGSSWDQMKEISLDKD